MAPNQRHVAWDIYARNLWALGHGHAVWHAHHVDRLTVGAVGTFHRGAVSVFFDALKPAVDQKRYNDGELAIPPGFVPLEANATQIDERRDAISAGIFCKGMTLQQSNALSDRNTSSVGPHLRQWTPFHVIPGADAGAAIELASAADTRELTARTAIVSYIGTHLHVWDAYTQNDLRRDLRPDQLFLVSGTVKTTGWAALAASAPSVRVVSCKSGDVAVMATEELAVSPESHGGGAWPHADATAPRDCVVFVHYYKAKPRDGGLRAAQEGYTEFVGKDGNVYRLCTEEEDIDPEDDDESLASLDGMESVVKTRLPRMKEFDPVGALLDYILENSEADLAIASTRDVYALRPENEDEWADIPALLNKVRPTIHVDERGVGTISAAAGLHVDQAGVALDGN